MSLLPLAVPWLSGSLFLLLDGRKRRVALAAAAVLLAVFALDLALLIQLGLKLRSPLDAVTGGWAQGVGIRLHVDRLAVFFGAVSTAVLAAVLLHESSAGVRSRLFPGLVLLLATGLHGAFFTADVFNFYVFFELSIVTSVALAAYGYERAEIRGSFVYVAVNLLGSVLFLTGVAMLYHATGTLDFEEIAARTRGAESSVVLSATLLFAALSIKLGLFPFHGWVPVLYSHARPAVVAALSGALVNIGAYGLVRFGYDFLEPARREGAVVLLSVGALAAVYGSLLALRRRTPAELAAYLAVVHAGYIVLALGLGGAHGVAALLLLVLSGSADKSMMFLALETSSPARTSLSLVAAGSAAGFPLTLGFLGKVELFHAAAVGSTRWGAVAALLASATLAIAASFRFWRLARRTGPANPAAGISVLVLAVTTVVLGIAAAPVVGVAWEIASDLVGVPE